LSLPFFFFIFFDSAIYLHQGVEEKKQTEKKTNTKQRRCALIQTAEVKKNKNKYPATTKKQCMLIGVSIWYLGSA